MTEDELERLKRHHREQKITIEFYQDKMRQHRDLMRAFVTYWLRDGGCGMCGGVPHSTTCFVGRMDAMLKGETVLGLLEGE